MKLKSISMTLKSIFICKYNLKTNIVFCIVSWNSLFVSLNDKIMSFFLNPCINLIFISKNQNSGKNL